MSEEVWILYTTTYTGAENEIERAESEKCSRMRSGFVACRFVRLDGAGTHKN